MSPELLIRRLVYADRSYKFSKPENENNEFYEKIVLGKEYKSGKKSLAAVIKDLVNHPNCREFGAERLCRF